MKELQKLRQRPNGINIVGLALGKKVTVEEEATSNGQAGGMVNLQALKAGKLKPVDDAYETGIGKQFSVETNKRDEDQEMMKYIDEEMRRRKGGEGETTAGEAEKKYFTPEEAALYSLPSHLRATSGQKSEEMLSNQMLNGIPEVDLGIDAKIKNIEATEEAKQRMIQEQKKKKDGPSHFVPVNYAANFTHHDRFNHDKDRRKRQQQQQEGGQEGSKPTGGHKNATDDYYFDKFRNKFRKH